MGHSLAKAAGGYK